MRYTSIVNRICVFRCLPHTIASVIVVTKRGGVDRGFSSLRLSKRPLCANTGRPHNDAIDPGCVKTCTSQEYAELFSLSSSLSSGRKHIGLSNLRNRDGISTRRWNVGVFTQPRPP